MLVRRLAFLQRKSRPISFYLVNGSRFYSEKSASFYKELSLRGLVYQNTHGLSSEAATCDPIKGVYLGIDPTAPSLHIGHLLGVISMIHATRFGMSCNSL